MRDDDDKAREDERVTIDEARRRGAAGGIEPAAPSFADETGTTDLGVNEPRVLVDRDEDDLDGRSRASTP